MTGMGRKDLPVSGGENQRGKTAGFDPDAMSSRRPTTARAEPRKIGLPRNREIADSHANQRGPVREHARAKENFSRRR
jgi:hypothetical protein